MSDDCPQSFSKWKGDCARPDVPDVSEGFQLHYGPTSMDDPVDVARFTLAPGDEVNDCLTQTTPNDADIHFDRYSMSMRPGAHHMVVTCTAGDSPDGELSACSEGGGILGPGCWLFSSQGRISGTYEEDFPPADVPVPPENEGLSFSLGRRTRVRYNMHFINSTDDPILRESWTNVYYADESKVTQIAAPISFAGGLSMNVAPHTSDTIRVTCPLPATATEPLRILDLVSHTHAHDRHFSASKVDAQGNRTALYDSYDWQEPLHAHFDSLTKNPRASSDHDSAISGLLMVSPGDTLEYACEIANDLDTALRFSNQVYTAEMCNLFGSYTSSVGSAWGCVGP